MKKVQDHYFKKAKKENYPARSVFKLEEAQLKFGLLKKNDRVLDLGCQPGSWSLYAAKFVGPQGLIVGLDLNEGENLYRTGAAEIQVLSGDIMDPGIFERLREKSKTYQVVLSDMAPSTTGNKWTDQQRSLDLSRRALELATGLLTPGGNFYCKVFEGEDFKPFVETVRSFFQTTKVFKPKSSRSESREVFVLALGFEKGLGQK